LSSRAASLTLANLLKVRKKDTNNIYAMKMLSKDNLKKQQSAPRP
jgi:hypothetical protein